ncbi:MAG: Wzz/FepE/Etk N-terminal domain-containing protein [Parvibaculales bacterium]
MVAVVSELSIQNGDEIDLVQLIETLWIGKWKIAWIAVIPVLLVVGFQFTQPPASFIAKTEIRKISSVEAQRYSESNAVGFFKVSRESILGLFIEQLEERKILEEAIRKFELLDPAEYEDEKEYNDAVIKLAASIVILPPQSGDGLDARSHWEIEFEFNDEFKWLDALAYATAAITEKVRTELQNRFDTSLAIAKQKRAFALEDIETKISNSLIDYERKTTDRLAFLGEQAAIARKLGVPKNTIEAQTFSAQSGMVANIKTDTPFYLRGFEAIEKEMELLGSRNDARAFVSGLRDLEIKKRELEQDKTLERASSLFALTPILTPAEFSAVSITLEATDFENQSRFLLWLGLAVIIGGLIGAVFVLVTDAMQKRKGIL